MKRETGYSLIELLVAVSILGVILTGVFYSFGVQNEKYVVVDQVTDAQQSLRGVTELIERDVRRSGYMVPPAASACSHDYSNQPDRLFVSETESVRSIDELKASAPELLVGELGIKVVSFNATTVRVTGGGTPVLKLDPGATGGLVVNGGVILLDREDPEQRVACGTISAIAGDTLTVDFGPSAHALAIGTSDVIAVPAVSYRIVPETSTTPSQLLRNGLVLAYDVEDMQAVFYFDRDLDGAATVASEVFGTTNAAGTYPPAPTTDVDMSRLREVTVSVVTVTQDEPPATTGASPTLTRGLVVANRTTSLAPADRRSRRLQMANVRVRNLG